METTELSKAEFDGLMRTNATAMSSIYAENVKRVAVYGVRIKIVVPPHLKPTSVYAGLRRARRRLGLDDKVVISLKTDMNCILVGPNPTEDLKDEQPKV